MGDNLVSSAHNITLPAEIFAREMVARLSEAREEPDWMREKRHIAWSLFAEIPMPTSQDEHWRRTNLNIVKWDALRLPESIHPEPAPSPARLAEELRVAWSPDAHIAGRLVMLNGHAVWHELQPKVAAQGVLFMDLTAAVRHHPDLVRQHLMQAVAPGEANSPP